MKKGAARYDCTSSENEFCKDRLHRCNRDLYGVGDGRVGEAVADGSYVTVFVIVAVEACGLVEAHAGEFVDFGTSIVQHDAGGDVARDSGSALPVL